MALNETGKAEKLYKGVIKNNSAWKKNSDVFVQAHINLAKIFLSKKDSYNAKCYFLRSLYLDESRIESYYALALIYLDEGNEQKAAAFLIKSARINPPLRLTAIDNLKIRLESIYYLADLLIKWQRYSEAEQILKPAIKNYSMVPQYLTQMGKILLSENKMKESARYFSQSIQLSPDNNNDAYKGMAKIYSMLGDKETAGAYLQKMESL
jgi:tetratricopeptide (TPR) repeat protein